MESRFQNEGYEFVVENGGDPIVVEDLRSASYAYAQDVKSRPYEIRKKGVRLGRFGSIDDVRDFLSEQNAEALDKRASD